MWAGGTLNDANLAKDGEIFRNIVGPRRDRLNLDKRAPKTNDAPATSQQSGTIL
jgi:hypothetical protein